MYVVYMNDLMNFMLLLIVFLNRWESSSQSLRLHLLQLKNLNKSVVRDGYKV